MRAVVRCAAGPGDVNETEGWGECTALPEPTFSAEYTAGAVEVSERYIVPALLQAGCARAEDVVPALSFLKGHRMAKAAFEAALLDAQLKWAGVRLADYLGLREPYPVKGRSPTVTAGVAVGLTSSLGELLDEVAQRTAEGYRRVKLKIKPGWDEEPLSAVRGSVAGTRLVRRCQRYVPGAGFHGGRCRLARLDGYGLACIEQPLGDDDLMGHARLARRIRTPVCLDEALTSLASVSTALEMGACSVVT